MRYTTNIIHSQSPRQTTTRLESDYCSVDDRDRDMAYLRVHVSDLQWPED